MPCTKENMPELFYIPVVILYILVVGLLFIYGVNSYYLTHLSKKLRRIAQNCDSAPVPGEPEDWPNVTIQLPLYNERYVAERLVKAAASLDYPRERLQIQVLDDSTDDTTLIVRQLVSRLQGSGVDICLTHRHNREGYKAGALGEGFKEAKGEFIAIFDADFVPRSDFLKKVIPRFADPEVAFVQARWEHLNTDYSMFTRLQSYILDAYFLIEQFARSQAGYWFNFNGTAGMWRRIAIEDAGGWKAGTLTEDLDLSYCAFLRGWKAVYAYDVSVPSELPVSFSAYRRQQHRWARGGLECAARFMPLIWRSPITLGKKIQATFHLTGYLVQLLLLTLTLLYPLVLLLSPHLHGLANLFGFIFLFNVTAFAPVTYFVAAQGQLGKLSLKSLPLILFTSILGSGMMLNTLRAAIQIVQRKQNVFERTPKYGIIRRNQEWLNARYNLKLDPIVSVELVYACFNLWTVWFALLHGNLVIAFYAALFSSGLFFTSSFTVIQALTRWQKYPKPRLAPDTSGD